MGLDRLPASSERCEGQSRGERSERMRAAADEHYQALFEHQPIAQESYRLIEEARITRLATVDRAYLAVFANATISSPP